MPSRIFQGVILQLKECTDRTVGVIDGDGAVICCTDQELVGCRYPVAVEMLNRQEGGDVQLEDKRFRSLGGWNGQIDYAAFMVATPEEDTLLSMAAVALGSAKAHYEEKHDRGTFVKNIITDNILLGDIYVRARELHFPEEACRSVYLVRQTEGSNPATVDVIASLFPDRSTDFVLSINDSDVAVIRQLLPREMETRDLIRTATQLQEHLEQELHVKCVIGIGMTVNHLQDLARAYKEADVAIEVGKVFNPEATIINYETLGIGRLIYQLPTTLCAMFLQEVFKKNPIDSLDQETLFTINRFFENNLNVSETARKLFVHRNTLVYRLEKIKKLTGLDLREFDDAITFKVALMVRKYLRSRGINP